MIGKIIKSISKQLIVIGIVIAISIAIMSVNLTAGIILMMIYSSWMVIKSSNKEMPLNKFTALLPGIMSLAIFSIMLGLIEWHDGEMPLIGLGLGIIPGWLMARGHDVYEKNGVVYAKRTFFYVFIWVISILFTQGSTLLGMREITDFSLLLIGFSTAMMVVLSIILLQKIFPIEKQNFPTANIINILLPAFVFTFTIIPFSQIVASNGHLKYGKHCNTNSECAGNLMCVNNTCTYKLGRKLDINPAGLMSNAQRIEDPEKLREYQDTFQNRNTARTAEEKAQAVQYSGLNTQNTTSTSTSTQDWVLGDCRNYGGHSGKECSSGKHCASGMCRGHGVPGMDGERYLGYCCNSSIFQSSSQSNPSPPQQSSSTSSSSSPSSESSSFEDEVAKLSSDEYLKNLSFEEWEKNKENEEVKLESTPDSLELKFSDAELVAGAGAALLMALTSLALNASMIAAQGTTTLVMEASEEAVTDAILDSNSSLFDPYDDKQLPEEDGMYWDGYGERWMTRDEAEHFVSKLNQEKFESDSTRESELDAFEEQNERDREERQSDREQRLRNEGNIYDEKHGTWEKDPDYVPPRTDLDKFYDQVDYLDEHSHQLSDDRKEIVERILDRIGYENNAIDATNLTDENMQTMGNLTKSINTIIHSENEANIAEQDSATFQNYETAGEAIKYVGKQAGEAAELVLTHGKTKGAITSFIFETASNHDKSLVDNLKHSTFESVKTYSGNRWADMADKADKIGEITINAAWGAMMKTGEQLNEGKGMDGWEILKAAGEEAITDQLRSVFSDAAKGELDKIAEIKTKLKLDHISNQNSSELSDGFVDGVYKRFNHLAEQFDVNFDALSSQHFSEVADTLDGAFKNLAERLDDI